MSGEPTLKAPLFSRLDRALIVLVLGGAIALLLHLLVMWSSLPELVPTHYDFKGIPDAWGRRTSLLSFPGIAILQAIPAALIAGVLGRSAQRLRELGPASASRAQAFALVKTSILSLSFGEVLLFAWLQIRTIAVSLDQASGLGAHFTYVVLAFAAFAVFVIVFFFARSRPALGANTGSPQP